MYCTFTVYYKSTYIYVYTTTRAFIAYICNTFIVYYTSTYTYVLYIHCTEHPLHIHCIHVHMYTCNTFTAYTYNCMYNIFLEHSLHTQTYVIYKNAQSIIARHPNSMDLVGEIVSFQGNFKEIWYQNEGNCVIRY